MTQKSVTVQLGADLSPKSYIRTEVVTVLFVGVFKKCYRTFEEGSLTLFSI